MAKTDFKSVNDYIASQPRSVQPVLERVRSAIRAAVPRADEVIAYQIPAYKLQGTAVLFFAGWKEHYSLYPANERLVAAFKKDLEPYEVNDKGTIRFPLAQPVPVRLIARLAKFRAKEVAESAKAKTPPEAKSTKAKAPAKSKKKTGAGAPQKAAPGRAGGRDRA